MMSIISELTAPLLTIFGLMPIIFGFLITSPYGKIWKNDADRKRWIGALIQDSFRRKYKRLMGSSLNALDSVLSADETSRNLSPIRTAWSNRLLTYTYVFAVAYPALSVALQWLSGTTIMFGNQTILDAGTLQARLVFGVWFGSMIMLFCFFMILQSRLRLASLILATAICVAGLILSDYFEVPSSVAIAGTGTAAVLATTAAITTTTAGAATFALAFSSIITLIIVVLAAGTSTVGGVIAATTTTAVAFVIACAAAIVVENKNARFGSHPKRLAALICMYFCGLSLAVIIGTLHVS